ACAHRYIYKADLLNYHMYPGICYINRRNLGRSPTVYDECLKRNKADAKGKGKDPKIQLATYERYQYCQMGVSSVFIPEKKTAMFGAPGSFNYQGLIFYSESDIEFKNDQIGYQDVVTGAPRHNHHGMVVVFERDDYKIHKVIPPPRETDGQQHPGSGFGYSVVGVDVNNDSLTDILVGAPYYSVKDSFNEGRVFVYMNKGNGVFEKTLELAPSVTRNMAQFGHVVARVGDLDQDGYEDVAIGAPYEDKTGVVYIFNGSASGLTKTPAQVIKASDLNQKLSTFGYSIAGRLDMDGNGYPDLLIGAYESDSVAFLRSRPIIEIKAEIEIKPNPFDIRSKNCMTNYKGKKINTACMSMKLCLGYKERKGRLTEKLSMDLEIESDVEYEKEARVLFNATSKPIYNKTLTQLPLDPARTCFVEYVFLRSKVEDIYPDITFKINYKMHQLSTPPTAAPGSLPSLAGYAMLEEHQKTFATAVLQFKRDCVKCEPDLIVTQKSPKTLAVGEQGYQMDITVTNSGESAYNSRLLVTIPEGVTLAEVKNTTDSNKKPFSISHRVITEFNVGDDNSTRLSVPIDNPLKNSATRKVRVRLSTGNFSKSQDFLPIELKVVSSNPEPEKHMADNIINLNVTIVSKADLELSGSKSQEQVNYGGKVIGESAMINEEQVGNEVTHTYIVQNLGPDLVPEAEIEIQWPHEAESGKHLLYLMDVIVSGRGKCHFLPDQINLLDLMKKSKSQLSTQNVTTRDISPDETLVRKRRELQSEQIQAKESQEKRQTSAAVKKEKQNIVLDCKIGTARCTPIRCTMNKLTKGDEVSFVVRSRLWNGTLLEDYYGKSVQVVSRASVKSLVTFVQEQNAKNNVAKVTTRLNPDFAPSPKTKLAAWVIPVAIVGAILALAIIILGFFKRKKFDGNMTDAEREEMMAETKKEKQPFET
ncbi:hypothetical protein QZH41_014118, partial [Actinostola sp. cb2023]